MRIFIDFDNTIVDTTKAFVEWYNNNYYQNVNYLDIREYDFNPHIHLSSGEISESFTTKELYNYLNLYPNVYSTLHKLKNVLNCELILITNCSDKSVMRKMEWLEDHKPLSSLFNSKIFLSIHKPYDKTLVDMSNSILIDDHKENHKYSNAKYKFAYKDNPNRMWYPTYEEDTVIVKDSWVSLYEEIEKIVCQNKNNIN